MSVYERPTRPPSRDQREADETQFRDRLLVAIDEDPRIRDAILRLFAANRARKTKATPAPAARIRLRRRT